MMAIVICWLEYPLGIDRHGDRHYLDRFDDAWARKMQQSRSELSDRQRRAMWRAWHRGMQEMDLILGRFAVVRVPEMDDAELSAFERLLLIEDTDLHGWLLKGLPVPEQHRSTMLDEIFSSLETTASGGRS
jgi:antitoxin CptB